MGGPGGAAGGGVSVGGPPFARLGVGGPGRPCVRAPALPVGCAPPRAPSPATRRQSRAAGSPRLTARPADSLQRRPPVCALTFPLSKRWCPRLRLLSAASTGAVRRSSGRGEWLWEGLEAGAGRRRWTRRPGAQRARTPTPRSARGRARAVERVRGMALCSAAASRRPGAGARAWRWGRFCG